MDNTDAITIRKLQRQVADLSLENERLRKWESATLDYVVVVASMEEMRGALKRAEADRDAAVRVLSELVAQEGAGMMDEGQAYREQTLDEYVGRLPSIHRASKELATLREENERLRAERDAAIEHGEKVVYSLRMVTASKYTEGEFAAEVSRIVDRKGGDEMAKGVVALTKTVARLQSEIRSLREENERLKKENARPHVRWSEEQGACRSAEAERDAAIEVLAYHIAGFDAQAVPTDADRAKAKDRIAARLQQKGGG